MTTATDGSGIGVSVSIQAALGQLSSMVGQVGDTMTKIHKFMTENPRQSPIVRPLRGSVVSDGSTYVYVALGAPAGGRIWDVRRIAIWKAGGVDPFPAVSNVSTMFGTMPSAPVNRGSAAVPVLEDLGLSPGAVPNDATFSAHEFTIRSGQQLVVVIKGTSNNDNYMVSGQAEEWVESTAERVVA